MKILNIVIRLLVLYQVLIIYGVEGHKAFPEEDMEEEKQLKILNKQPVKTFYTAKSDAFDCIDTYKQPALDHPLLKDHKIQMKPTSRPKGIYENPSKARSATSNLKGKRCPQGTVPIRRIKREDLIRTKSFSKLYPKYIHTQSTQSPGQHVAVLAQYNAQNATYHGGSAHINVYNTQVMVDQSTISAIWIENGPNDQRNSLQVGWMIAPEITGDNFTRLFSFSTTDNSNTFCFNGLCPGFVQVHNEITLGSEISPMSEYGNKIQQVVIIAVFQDKVTGNWWLQYSNTLIGYWAREVLPLLTEGASLVGWGGFAASLSNTNSPPMGNGHFPSNDLSKSCFIGNLHIVDASNNYVQPITHDLIRYVDNPKCYDLKYLGYFNKEIENVLVFGGPGGNCGI